LGYTGQNCGGSPVGFVATPAFFNFFRPSGPNPSFAALVPGGYATQVALAKAAGLIMERGARSVRAVCTHPVLSGRAYETIENSVLTELIVTDTIPLKHQSSKIKVLSTAELFAKAIENVNEHGSISQLFKVD